MSRTTAFVALALVLAGCSSSAKSTEPASTTTSPTTLPVDCTPARPAPKAAKQYTFQNRTYTLTLPADYDGIHGVPMIFGFHGHGANKELFEIDTQLARRGAEGGYAVALVDGSGTPRTWRMFEFENPNGDYAQVTALVQALEKQLCIDTDRVFAAGHSAGSAFAGFLVCRAPFLFAGVAMVSATIPNLCPANHKLATIGIHGAKDPVVLYDGGKGLGQESGIPPFKATIAKTAAKNGCDATPTKEPAEPGIEWLTYTGCAAEAPVEAVTILEGNHPWPGGFQATHTKPVPVGADFDATNAIVDFFNQV